MPLDFIIGKSKFIKDKGELFDAIYDDEYKLLFSLVKNHNNWVFNKLSNIYEDQNYNKQELETSLDILFEVVKKTNNKEEKKLIYKLITVFSYALRTDQELWANAD